MTELIPDGVADAHEETATGGETVEYHEPPETTAERDRDFFREVGAAALVWALIRSAIIASLLLFGDAITAVVV